ncbi:MAG: hypothetical protein NTY48_05635 [Candidatus Diapherotrites archaeon]|nr:hypothetical protein [Candidatus Diapherotrites archaeon]
MQKPASSLPARLKLSRKRIPLHETGKALPQFERRTYSGLDRKESIAAFEIYKRLRKILAKNRKFFLDGRHNIKFYVRTSLGGALIENVRGLRKGEYSGSNNWGTLKISLNGKEMFVKIEDTKNAKSRVLGARIVESFLERHKWKFREFNVINAPVHVAHDFLYEKYPRTIYATDFYPKERFVMIENIGDLKVLGKVTAVIHKLNNSLLPKTKSFFVGEISINNALYCAKTKTIVLFDLHATSRNQLHTSNK